MPSMVWHEDPNSWNTNQVVITTGTTSNPSTSAGNIIYFNGTIYPGATQTSPPDEPHIIQELI